MKFFNYTVLFIFLSLASCTGEEEEILVNETSIAPATTSGRPNNYLGCIEISNRNVTIEAWDHGQIDGDIISLMANGNTILSNHELDGPSNSVSLSHNFGYNGYNYLVLYAHNEGDISPNTAALSINGQQFILESNLSSNGYVDIVVTGYGVTCSSSGPVNNSEITFWVGSDLGCGSINVTLENVGSGSITSYYSSSPDCGASGCANFSNLAAGTYNFTASCPDYNWSGTISVSEDQCSKMQLTL